MQHLQNIHRSEPRHKIISTDLLQDRPYFISYNGQSFDRCYEAKQSYDAFAHICRASEKFQFIADNIVKKNFSFVNSISFETIWRQKDLIISPVDVLFCLVL